MVIEQIKKDLLEARKKKNILISNLLGVLIADAEKLATQKTSRAPTDQEVFSIIRKMIENNELVIKTVDIYDSRSGDAMAEIRWLKQYLPLQMSRGEIFDAIHRMPSSTEFSVPSIMKYFKANFPDRYNGKELSEIAKEIVSK